MLLPFYSDDHYRDSNRITRHGRTVLSQTEILYTVPQKLKKLKLNPFRATMARKMLLISDTSGSCKSTDTEEPVHRLFSSQLSPVPIYTAWRQRQQQHLFAIDWIPEGLSPSKLVPKVSKFCNNVWNAFSKFSICVMVTNFCTFVHRVNTWTQQGVRTLPKGFNAAATRPEIKFVFMMPTSYATTRHHWNYNHIYWTTELQNFSSVQPHSDYNAIA